MIDQNKLKEPLYDTVREARAACFENGRVLEKMIPEYRRVLYDVDREFAVQNEFSVVKAESEKTTAAQPGLQPVLQQLLVCSEAPGLSSYDDDLDDDDSIALDMEEAIDDDIMFHGGNPFDWDTRSDYLDDPFGFGDDGIGGNGDEW